MTVVVARQKCYDFRVYGSAYDGIFPPVFCERNSPGEILLRRTTFCAYWHIAEPYCLADPPREEPPDRDATKALETKLVDSLARIDDELRETQNAAAAAAAVAAANTASTQVCCVRRLCERLNEPC